jgi:hypothetical protein
LRCCNNAERAKQAFAHAPMPPLQLTLPVLSAILAVLQVPAHGATRQDLVTAQCAAGTTDIDTDDHDRTDRLLSESTRQINEVARITQLWKEFLATLGTGVVEDVLAKIAISQRESFRKVYADGGMTPSTPSTLPGMVTRFAVTEVSATSAQAMVLIRENGVEQAYFVIFATDDDGVWRLFSM